MNGLGLGVQYCTARYSDAFLSVTHEKWHNLNNTDNQRR